jgi:hypothetical protein
MTHPIPSETIEYEQYVDGLRHQNAQMHAALQIAESTLASFYRIQYAQGLCKMADGPDNWVLKMIRDAISDASLAGYSGLSKTITIHVEGGLVQNVAGTPAGYEVRVEDYDNQDDVDPMWDAEKKCVVTVYGGDNASDFPTQAPKFNIAQLADVMTFPSEILQLTEIDADDGDLALQALSEIRLLARNTAAKVKGGPR